MSETRSHEEIEEALGAYALDAVEPEEAAAIELHLRDCPRCRTEVAQHREVAAKLGYAGSPAPEALWLRIRESLEEAPPALRLAPRILDGIAGSRAGGAREGAAGVEPDGASWRGGVPGGAEGAVAEDRGVGSGGVEPARPRPAAWGGRGAAGGPAVGGPGTPVLPDELASRRAARDRRRLGLRPFAAAAAVVVIVGLGFEVARLQNQVSVVGRRVAIVGRVGGQAESRLTEQLIQAIGEPGVTKVDLTSTTSNASAEAVILPSGQGYLFRNTLPGLPSSETYQLWAVTGSKRISLGLLGNRPGLVAFTTEPAAHFQLLAVTAEPAGGVEVTTAPAVVWGPPVST